jgi:hypothetical protein
MTEVWKPLLDKDVQQRYAISNLGRVFDLFKVCYLRWLDNGAGYKIVGLQRKDKNNVSMRYVHRLVALHFIQNPDNLPQVGHKDHEKDNNKESNLYWTTAKQNTADGIRDGRINAKKRPGTRKLSKSEICFIALLKAEGLGVNEIARKIGCPRTTVSSVFNKRSNWELFSFVLEEVG